MKNTTVKNGILGHYDAGPEREDYRKLNLEESWGLKFYPRACWCWGRWVMWEMQDAG